MIKKHWFNSQSRISANRRVVLAVALFTLHCSLFTVPAWAQSVVDEVVWVVGDEPILKSDIEQMRLQAAQEGIRFKGNPDCAIPEQIAVQKLFLHQAAIDSIEVTEAEISAGIDQQIEYWTQMAGSREKLEEYKKQTVSQMRAQLHDDYRDRQMVQKMREKLVSDVKVTPRCAAISGTCRKTVCLLCRRKWRCRLSRIPLP